MLHGKPIRAVETIRDINCFLLDMDGTVYLDHNWISGALALIDSINQSGKTFCFLTNNSSKDAASYIRKLEGMGLVIDPETQLLTSGQATVSYLRQHFPKKRVFLLGNEYLSCEFTELGIELSETDPQLVVTAFDTSLTYDKLRVVCDLVRNGLPYIATHPDFNCPTSDGYMPDIGAIHAFIHASTGRNPDVIIGKPNPYIIDIAIQRAGSSREQVAVVGDRLYTDIASARNSGVTGILVLSGETSLGDLEELSSPADFIFDSVADLIPYIS